MGLMKTLRTAVNLQAELSTNVDVDDGLANGASCVIMAVQVDDRTTKPSYIWVKFHHEKIGRNLRKDKKHLYHHSIPPCWTPISQVKRQFKVGRYKTGEVLRSQFPLRPSSGKTAHRCQGDTMATAVVDFTGRSFPHVHYVALSRVQSLHKLYITNLRQTSISVSEKVKSEVERLHKDKNVTLSLQYLCNEPLISGKFKCVFLNVRSLNKHIQDIKSDTFFDAADMMIFVETKLVSIDAKKDVFKIPGFEFYSFHFPATKNRSPYGIAIYSKRPILTNSIEKIQRKEGIEISIIDLANVYEEKWVIVAVYVSPKVTFTKLKPVLQDMIKKLKQLDSAGTVIFGDFNIDLISNANHEILSVFGDYEQKIHVPTTDYRSLLDHVYSDVPNDKSSYGVFDSYFSDHKPVWSVLF